LKSLLRAMALFALIGVCVVQLGRPVSAAEATTGLIVGTVTAADGTPLANAIVSAASPSGRYTATSNARGQFTMLGVVADTYIITAQSPG
jgi:hypothetical protein